MAGVRYPGERPRCQLLRRTASIYGEQGDPVQTYLAKDGATLAFRHEPMSLTELSLSEAMRKSVEQHLAEAQAGPSLSAPGETAYREMAR